MATSHKNRTVKKSKIEGDLRFTVYMPKDVHSALAEAAKEHRRSMTDEACIILSERFFLNSETQLKTRVALLEGRVEALEEAIKSNRKTPLDLTKL
ncbi:MAG: hypothetical protein Pg6A_20260 [Termitinemataceae bacterium]|nr:MAG: hypothetical protein Pg6A_20260 [Termitinemataceae bacterium]